MREAATRRAQLLAVILTASLLALALHSPNRADGSHSFSYVQYVAQHSGKCIDVNTAGGTGNGQKAQQWSCGLVFNQQFAVESIPSTSFHRIKVRHTGKCLDVTGANYANGTPIQQWDCNYSPAAYNQHFLIPVEYGISQIRTRLYGNKCFDITNGSASDGAIVQIWDCNPANPGHQRFRADVLADVTAPTL
jgi:hypothetical protein